MREFAEAWLGHRDLEDWTRVHYDRLLRAHAFGTTPVPAGTPAEVRTWHAVLGKHTGPMARAHGYPLLRTITNTAVAALKSMVVDGLMNGCVRVPEERLIPGVVIEPQGHLHVLIPCDALRLAG